MLLEIQISKNLFTIPGIIERPVCSPTKKAGSATVVMGCSTLKEKNEQYTLEN